MHEKDAGVGATRTDVPKHKCSIKKVTVSTSWKAPNKDVPEDVEAVVFDKSISNKGKTIYLISSPKGKNVTIKVDREEGACPSPIHKRYEMTYPGCQDEDEGTNTEYIPYDTKNESTVNIKYFKIEGIKGFFSYINLPIHLNGDKNYTNIFNHVTCKERFNYTIVSYPDISFKWKISLGMKEVELGNTSDYTPKFTPAISATVSFNGGKDKLEFTAQTRVSMEDSIIKGSLRNSFDFDKSIEYFHVTYEHDSELQEFGSEFFQSIPDSVMKIVKICDLLSRVCNAQFINAFRDFDSGGLDYKPYKLTLYPPNGSISGESRYHTSKSLLKVGVFRIIQFAFDPLVSIEFKLDLFYLLIAAVTAGGGTEIYILLKNLDKVVEELLGKGYKQQYNDTKPFECEVYINFIIKGTISKSFPLVSDSINELGENSDAISSEVVVKVELETGIKISLNVFIIAIEGEASISGSCEIKFKFEYQHREESSLYIETIFLGAKIKYCVKGKIGLMETWNFGGSLTDNEKKLLEAKKIENLSGWVWGGE